MGSGQRSRFQCSLRNNETDQPSRLRTTVPELEQSKISVLATLPSAHSAGRIGTPSRGSLIGIVPSLGLGSIVALWFDIGRS
jgi:hypothetical protein